MKKTRTILHEKGCEKTIVEGKKILKGQKGREGYHQVLKVFLKFYMEKRERDAMNGTWGKKNVKIRLLSKSCFVEYSFIPLSSSLSPTIKKIVSSNINYSFMVAIEKASKDQLTWQNSHQLVTTLSLPHSTPVNTSSHSDCSRLDSKGGFRSQV